MFSVAILTLVLGQAIFMSHARAFSTFAPNCTLPPPETNFVSATGVRSTLDILWSSLAVIILCTWNILHLNVPRMRGSAGFWKARWWSIIDSWTKIKWMLLTFLAPELILAKAANELVAARWPTNEDERQRPIRNYLANMGYFVLDWKEAAANAKGVGRHWEAVPAEEEFATADPEILFREHQRYFENYGGWSQSIEVDRLMSRYWAPNAAQWVTLQELGVAQLPDTPEYLLEKLDNSGGIVRLLALAQITWLIIQLIARQRLGKPSSQLEVASLAYAGQSILTYLCYFSRPRDVSSICIITAKLPPRQNLGDWRTDPSPLRRILRRISENGPSYLMTDWRRRSAHAFDPAVGPAPIPNDAVHHGRDEKQLRLASVIVTLGGIVFGGLHCLAWNSSFPSRAEAVLWKVCAIATTILPLTSAAAYGAPKIYDLVNYKRRFYHGRLDQENAALKLISLVVLLLYMLVRLCLIVEMFRTLFYLPPEVYYDTWTAEIPHGG